MGMLDNVTKSQYLIQLSEVSNVSVPSSSEVHGQLNVVKNKINGVLKELSELKTPVDERELYTKLEEIDIKLKYFDDLPDSKFSSNEKRGARIHDNIHKCEEIVSQIMKQLAGGENVSKLASGQSDLNAAMLEKKTLEAAALAGPKEDAAPLVREAKPFAVTQSSSQAEAPAVTSGKAEVKPSGGERKNYEEVYKTYSVPLSTDPPKPSNGINRLDGNVTYETIIDGDKSGKTKKIDEKRRDVFTNFINAKLQNGEDIYSKSQKEALLECFNKTEHVSWNEFNDQLDVLADYINNAFPEGKDYVAIVKHDKSNKWIAELMGPRLKHLPLDALHEPIRVVEFLAANPSVRDIVFFDDAVYSGTQLSGYMQEIVEKLAERGGEKMKETVCFNIVAPYMTTYSEERFVKLNESGLFKDYNFKIAVAPHQTMQSAAVQVDEKHHRALSEIYWPDPLPPVESQDQRKGAAEYLIKYLDNLRWDSSGEKEFILKNYEGFEEIFKKLEERMERRYGDAPDSEQEYTVDEMNYFMEKTRFITNSYKDAFAREDFRIRKIFDRTYNYFVAHEDLKPYFPVDPDKGLHSRTLTVFDHKTADDLSTLPCYDLGTHWRAGMKIESGYDKNGDIMKKIPIFAHGKQYASYKPKVPLIV